LDVETAVSCGLIVNEIISNSLKHAFPAGREGKIDVRLKLTKGDMLNLEIADNGIGMRPDLDIHSTDSLGLQLVNTLVDQLDGRMEINGQRGTKFKIAFAVPGN
jgi:two-component sensor histidine kinase